MQASFSNINSWLLIRKYGIHKPIDDKLLKELKEKKNVNNIKSRKTILQIEGQIKTFPDNQILKEPFTSRRALQELPQGVLPAEMKACYTVTWIPMKN